MQHQITVLQNYRRSILSGLLVGLGAGAIFMAGFLLRGFVDVPQVAAAGTVSYGLVGEVQSLLDAHFLREQPTEKAREYAAVRGLIGSLNDRFTFFIEPIVAQSESDVLAGTYGGVGVQIQRSEQGEFILYPYPDSPVLEAGIAEGDILVKVNGNPVDISIQQDQIDQLLRGEVKDGSGVELGVLKSETREPLSVFVPFAVINVPSVTWRMLPDMNGLAYLQISLFTSRTPEELQTGLQQLSSEGAAGLILDLRNNSGGLLHESVKVAEQFLDGGVVVYEKTKTSETPLTADTGGAATTIPLVVLVNQGTASAAELVAGAIRDRGRAILIGQQTYGKGTVQQIFRLSDESSIHITAAEWLTPNRSHIDGTGLAPDITMIPDLNGRDVELGEAVRQLNALLPNQGG
jgi:carboxyl-terminal processing protease